MLLPLLVLIVGVIAIFLAFSFKESTKEIDERKDQKDKYYHNLIEKQEMNRQGFPNVYINGLGENPLLKHSFKEGRKLEKESRFKDAIKEFKTCLLHPAATNSNKVAAHNLIGIC